MTLHPVELETIFENLETHRHLDLWRDKNPISFNQLQSLRLIEEGNFQQSLSVLEALFVQTENTLTQLFCIQWAVAIAETIYDLPLRKRWIQKWNEVPQWSSDAWGRYLHRFQSAVQHYYDQSLSDSERLFQANLVESEKLNYPRGSVRSLFHLGLIYRSWGQTDRALDFFGRARNIAQTHNLLRSETKIKEQQSLLHDGVLSNEQNLAAIENHLKKGKLRASRKLILFCCRKRRAEKRNWKSLSENAYLAIVCYGFERHQRFQFLLTTIDDTLVLEQTLRLADQIRPLEAKYRDHLDYLQGLSGYTQLTRSKDSSKVTIGTQTITQTDDREVTLLLNALIERENGIDKEQISALLWNVDYDPYYHDPKIYRVIHRARKRIGIPDLIVNKYGLYVLGTHLRSAGKLNL